MPPTAPRRPWVAADGTIDEEAMPKPPERDPWLRDDGTVDCTAVADTIGVVTVDGKLLMDRGREVRVPNLAQPGGCGPEVSPALQAAWTEKIDRLAAATVRSRGREPLPPPRVEEWLPDEAP